MQLIRPDRLINIAIIIIMGIAGYWLATIMNSDKPNIITQPQPDFSIEKSTQTMGIIELPPTPAPKFSFTDINGNTHNIQDFKGKNIILNFWATWCAPCVVEFPKLIKLANENPDNIVLIALSSDINDAPIHRFISKISSDPLASNIIIARDTHQAITQGKFQTYRLPETYIINKKGELQTKIIGAEWTEAELKNTFKN